MPVGIKIMVLANVGSCNVPFRDAAEADLAFEACPLHLFSVCDAGSEQAETGLLLRVPPALRGMVFEGTRGRCLFAPQTSPGPNQGTLRK
ncbi:uncharacterized protein N7473_007817 [Penicillium subrubescens]|uniref:Uncharacterized protein n=1 Tax=Penicillium subrubescens TaxID=1316194 RepID=A0A1Q5TJT0_9EURO|nr:uncharacterized protein N7473_007817 [Penicillium subrubescens]KAJ5891589.1 hypothetical protein N7473_007817 [Penicillium subrubescens]OKP00470.1 hypothetical protein PENSUB_7927 [Penicillium subrubescens]